MQTTTPIDRMLRRKVLTTYAENVAKIVFLANTEVSLDGREPDLENTKSCVALATSGAKWMGSTVVAGAVMLEG